MDEYRHTAEKLSKTENVMEKYKKKLEESADLRRRVKGLEEQNAALVDTNASLESEFRKVASFKPLMESYKQQINELEGKHTARSKEITTLKYELEQTKGHLKVGAFYLKLWRSDGGVLRSLGRRRKSSMLRTQKHWSFIKKE